MLPQKVDTQKVYLQSNPSLQGSKIEIKDRGNTSLLPDRRFMYGAGNRGDGTNFLDEASSKHDHNGELRRTLEDLCSWIAQRSRPWPSRKLTMGQHNTKILMVAAYQG